jgi:hypothetical protein
MAAQGSSPTTNSAQQASQPAPQPAIPPMHGYDDLLQHIKKLPLWLQQILYLDLRETLEFCLSSSTIDMFRTENLVQLWEPLPTRLGIQALHSENGSTPQSLKYVLNLCHQQFNVIRIAIQCQWNLHQVCSLLNQCLKTGLIQPPENLLVRATVSYLAGETRLGEYLVAVNKLSQGQLNQAMDTQSYISNAMGDHVRLGDILISLGYISKEDSEAILFLKEQCELPYRLVRGVPWVENQKLENIHNMQKGGLLAASGERGSVQPIGSQSQALEGLKLPEPPKKIKETVQKFDRSIPGKI